MKIDSSCSFAIRCSLRLSCQCYWDNAQIIADIGARGYCPWSPLSVRVSHSLMRVRINGCCRGIIRNNEQLLYKCVSMEIYERNFKANPSGHRYVWYSKCTDFLDVASLHLRLLFRSLAFLLLRNLRRKTFCQFSSNIRLIWLIGAYYIIMDILGLGLFICASVPCKIVI